MEKEVFKKKVLDWLAENKIIPKRVRVYNTRQYGLEVRIYNEPMEVQNSKRSFRETHREENEKGYTKYGHTGLFSRKVSTYTPINQSHLDSQEEKDFTLQVLRDNL